MKVLIADDSGVMRKIIVRALNSIGITDIVEAADGNEAVTKFGQQQFELVLSDWNMPGKTGLEVLKAIRAGGSTVPVVLITTEGEKRRVLEAIEAGVSDYVVKPFEASSLAQKITRFIEAGVAQ